MGVSNFGTILMCFICGVCYSLNFIIGFIMMCDHAPRTSHSYVGAFLNCMESLVPMIFNLCVNSQDHAVSAKSSMYSSLGMMLVFGSIIAYWVSESPKWHFENKKFK